MLRFHSPAADEAGADGAEADAEEAEGSEDERAADEAGIFGAGSSSSDLAQLRSGSKLDCRDPRPAADTLNTTKLCTKHRKLTKAPLQPP